MGTDLFGLLVTKTRGAGMWLGKMLSLLIMLLVFAVTLDKEQSLFETSRGAMIISLNYCEGSTISIFWL